MILSTRTGRLSRPWASFVKLAKHQAHSRQGIRNIGLQWRYYATEGTRAQETVAADSEALLSKCRIKCESRIRLLIVLQSLQRQGTMK
jgi:hypothetical protein